MEHKQAAIPLGTTVFFDEQGREIPGQRYVNPDGSLGGWVPVGIAVPDDVWIDHRSSVLPGAKLLPGQVIGPRELVE
jgi:acetyltransferase-like isoleucine patch superfamily enzyme